MKSQPVILITNIHPNAPRERAMATIGRLLALLGAPVPVSPLGAPVSSPRPRLTLIKGGKQDDPVKPPAA